MTQSRVCQDYGYVFDNRYWIVSLIATGEKRGGHAKIVVEGLKTDVEWMESKDNPEKKPLYIAEYHILSHGNAFNIIFSERPGYKDGRAEQYANATSRSYRVTQDRAMSMIREIKREKITFSRGNRYDYSGNYEGVSNQMKGHNCVTWCEEFLKEAGIGSVKLPKDRVIKGALPVKHASRLVKLLDRTTAEDGFPHPPAPNRSSFWYNAGIIGSAALGIAAVAVATIAKARGR